MAGLVRRITPLALSALVLALLGSVAAAPAATSVQRTVDVDARITAVTFDYPPAGGYVACGHVELVEFAEVSGATGYTFRVMDSVLGERTVTGTPPGFEDGNIQAGDQSVRPPAGRHWVGLSGGSVSGGVADADAIARSCAEAAAGVDSRYQLLEATASVDVDPDKGAVEGRVVETVCGEGSCSEEPVAGVRVSAGSASASTGADGTYRIEVDPGTYVVRPSLAGRVFVPRTRSVTVTKGRTATANFSTCGATAASFRLGSLVEQGRAASRCGPSGIDWTAPERLTPRSDETYRGPYGLARQRYVYPTSWRVNVFLTDGSKRYTSTQDCKSPRVQWRWTVAPGDQVVTGPKPGCSTSMQVKKLGKYDVVASKFTRKTRAGAWTNSGIQVRGVFEAKDWLIVAMGDSNGSGEANPPFQWDRCNRSEASHQWKLARFLETQDKRSSVTLIWPSCSGARMSHLISQPYSGTRPATPWLPPQIDQVLTVLNGREGTPRHPDAALISIGVNDLFFGAVGLWCATHPASELPNSPRCETMPVDFNFDEAANTYSFSAAAGKPSVSTWVSQFTAQLPAKYAQLKEALALPVDSSQGLGLTADQVVLSKYPDFSRDENGNICNTSGYSLPAINARPAVFRWNRNTWSWFGSAAAALNARITEAGALGFRYSNLPADAFSRHGYCAGTPPFFRDAWIRGPLYAYGTLDRAGPLHPTDPGHDVLAENMQAPFCRILYSNTTCTGVWRR